MSEKLAERFARVARPQWEQEAVRTAKVDAGRLKTRTEDGFELDAWVEGSVTNHEGPGQGSLRRGRAERTEGGWALRQSFEQPSLDRSNREILRDLARGVTDIELVLSRSAALGRDADRATETELGLGLSSVDDFDLCLAGVLEQLAPVHLLGGAAPLAQAALLLGLFHRRQTNLKTVRASLGAAPLSSAARWGEFAGSLEQHMEDTCALLRWAEHHAPAITVARANELPFHEAGATDGQGLGLILSEIAELLRAATQFGLSPSSVLQRTELVLAITPDVFASLCKLRALRLMISRLCELLSIAPQCPPTVAKLGFRHLTRTDPWVNMLRATAATFAGAAGGADAITLPGFDALFGPSNELGRRMARNTQYILQNESFLGHVIDPGGGSGYIETRTERLAESGWQFLQAVEGEGGLKSVLESGWLKDRLHSQQASRMAEVRTRKRPLTGTTEYPLPEEVPLERPQVADDPAPRLALCRAQKPSIAPSELQDRVQGAVTAALDGATLGLLTEALYPGRGRIQALPSVRLSEPFETLKEDVRSRNPTPIYLANVGAIARHTARATFIANLVGIGGFEVSHGPATLEPQTSATAFAESGAKVAIMCGMDEDYDVAPAFCASLRSAGAVQVWLAGRPGDRAEALQEAGLSGSMALRDDVLAHLQQLHLAHFGERPQP